MNSEIARIVKALYEIDAPAGIDELVVRSRLSRGKVLGNLPRLVIDGLITKAGRDYVITRRGRAVLARYVLVPENKGFHFYFTDREPSGLVARSLQEFYEVVADIDARSLEYHLRRGDFENWIRNVLHEEGLANDITELKRGGVSKETLRGRLALLIERCFKMSESSTR